ncbi:MAG: hypothetical protein ACJ8C4_20815 [Gemmataceae bacterium]
MSFEKSRKRTKVSRGTRLLVTELENRTVPNAGTLDASFGTGGTVTTSLGSGHADPNAIAVAPSGKIVVAGKVSDPSVQFAGDAFGLACYNANGTLDTTFGTNGRAVTAVSIYGSHALGVTVQPDGKIVAVGYANGTLSEEFAVVRYNANGTLDSTFGSGGIVITDFAEKRDIATCVTLQNDGKIVVAGTAVRNSSDYDHFAVVRYNTDGTLDSTFGIAGKLVCPISLIGDFARGVAIDGAGNIVVTGTATYDNNGAWSNELATARFLPNGDLDVGFATAGMRITHVTTNDSGRGLALQADGKIVVAGYSADGAPPSFTLVRYNNDGSLDITFQGGWVCTGFAPLGGVGQGVAIQSNGKIVAAGYFGSNDGFALARYNTDGTLDSGFGTGGKEVVPFTSPAWATTSMGKAIALQADGQIVVAGLYSDSDNYYQMFGVARFNAHQLPPTVTSVVFGDGTNQRSLVKQITVNFSEPVNFIGSVASCFTLHRAGSAGTIGDVTLTASPATGPASTVTLTFSGTLTEFDSLVDGIYNLIIDAAQVSGVGGALDGNGDTIPGGSHVVNGSVANKFFRLFGDNTGSGTVDQSNYLVFRDAVSAGPNTIFDFNHDGDVDQTDYLAFRDRIAAAP